MLTQKHDKVLGCTFLEEVDLQAIMLYQEQTQQALHKMSCSRQLIWLAQLPLVTHLTLVFN